MTILITAFEPFGGEVQNPTQEVLALLPEQIGTARIISLLLPTVFGEAAAQAIQAIKAHKPNAVVALGQAGGRAGITPERVAINVADARIPDNAGVKPSDEPINPMGPAAYFSTLPIKALVQAIREAGLPASVSDSAGTYVCNHLMYALLHHIAKEGLNIQAGFIHLPFLPAQAEGKTPPVPFMSLDNMKTGLIKALDVLAQPANTQ